VNILRDINREHQTRVSGNSKGKEKLAKFLLDLNQLLAVSHALDQAVSATVKLLLIFA
jgi:hypothetical protein